MKTGVLEPRDGVAPILQLSDAGNDATTESDLIARARAFAEPLLLGQKLESGEDTLAHADAVAGILQGIGSAATLRAAVYLSYAADHLNKPEDVIGKAFGVHYGALVGHTRKLVQILRSARDARPHRRIEMAFTELAQTI